MKKFSLILAAVICTFINVNAQWILQTPTYSAENRCVFMTSSDVGYIAGATTFGVILKTTDGGILWDTLPSGIPDTLRAITFVNDTVGFVSGANGRISKTTDAGITWNTQLSGVPNLLRSLFFVNEDTGYACGGGGAILKTTDGGNTWMQQASGTTQDLINVRFLNADTGYCVSSLSTFKSGLILKTMDGGATWDSVYSNINGLLGLSLVGDSIVYAGGGFETIVKSTDAGTTWTELASDTNLAYHFRSAFFLSPDTGYVVGDSGKIMYTSDGGTTWTNQGLNINGVLSIYCPTHDTCYACGALGTILKYTKPCIPAQPSIINGASSVCAGDTEMYYVAPVQDALSYTWQIPPGATILSGQSDTLIIVAFGTNTGNISVVSVNFCGSSPSQNLSVTVKPSPPIPVIMQVAGVLNSSSLVGNQWFLNDTAIAGATSPNYLPVQNGTYTVVVTFSNGCSSISPPFIVTNAGIDNTEYQYKLLLQPNPFAQNVNFTFNLRALSKVSVTLYDAIGNKVKEVINKQWMKGNQKVNVDCYDLPKGIYFVKFEFNKDVIFKKLIKE